MRQGSFTLDNLMNYVYGEQISKIPAKMYNDDAQVKYLDFGSLYTYCCHGSKEHQIRRWLRERIAYVDSMLGYFTSQEDQVTIRMNKDGKVSFEVTPYIPLYFSVKWSNATGGTQTFKLKRGETKTFNYSSTTSTDQEVIIYHAKYIKRLDNLSNLNPSSCILSNAVKLTNVEIHSSELYNINVTNNKFLRSINLENCTALGTVTATGSSLNLSNCKYLRYCNVYNTHLTEVQLNTSGGSLTEIYYPQSIQSINLVKQRLLELIGLPYGEGGSEIPTSLYTISIQECPSITKLNTSSDTTIASSFASMVYVNNLTIRNSLDLASLKFDGFHRLQNVTIENMYNLEEVGFNNLLPVGGTSTIKYIGMSNCPKLGNIELNCTSNDYEITFADDAILNFGGLFKLNSITSNCVLKGIKTIVVPINLESMFFTNEYGSGYSTIENIWVSSQCNVDTQATTPIVTHVDSTYSGIDFLGMNLKNIDLGALVNIPKAINFKLSPTTVNPHFNLNRDGETYKYLQPVGTLDLSNYTESLAKFFDGVDLDKLEIICNNNLPQTDLSYCFYNSSFSTNDAINKLLTKVSSITNLNYCFYRTTINSVDILEDINMGDSSSMNYTFAECPNIKELNSVVIPSNVTSVEGMFNKCPLTVINNMVVNVRGSISGLFKGCNKLTTINTLRIPNVTDVSNTFDGCTSLSSLSGFELPNSCTNVSNLFNGCYMLTELGMNFSSNITAGDNWYPPNLEALHDTTISNDYVKLTNCTTLKTLNGVNISGGDLSDLFNGCTNLVNINNCTFNATTSLARTFKGCSKITTPPITNIVDTITDISEMYSGCTGITDISGMTFGSGITNSTDCIKDVPLVRANDITIKSFFKTNDNNYKKPVIMFTDCASLVSAKNLKLITSLDGINVTDMFARCTNLADVNFVNPPKFGYCNYLFQNTSISKNTNGVIRLYEDLGITVNSISGATTIAMFRANPYIKEVIFPDEEFGNFSAQQLFDACTNLKIVRNLKSRYLGNMFRFCKGATNVELINCYITNPFVADGCSGITKLTNCTIPDSVTNIDKMFNGIGITDISGLTIGSGVTSAPDWIKGSPITIANNVTIKNGATKFNNCTTLTTCNNLTITSTCTSLNNLFNGCKSLNSITFNSASDFTNVTTMQSTFTGTAISSLDLSNVTVSHKLTNLKGCFSRCTKLTEITMFNKMEEASLSDISEIFIGSEEKLTTLRNFKLGSNCSVPLRCQYAFKYPTGKGTIISNTDGMYINCDCLRIRDDDTGKIRNEENGGSSNLYYSLFAGCDSIVKFTELELGPNVTDISNGFRNIIGLTEDVILPSHITNCENAFKDCTSMTHIHSNWNNTYDNEITSTDCYSGCTGITHVDDVNVITYEGKEGLDEVPESWGGYGFTKETTCVLEVVTTQSNYKVARTGSSDTDTGLITSWGDGTVDTLNHHTYETPGTYLIKTKGSVATANTYATIRQVLTKVKQMRRYLTNQCGFRDCPNLTHLNIDNCILYNCNLIYSLPKLCYISAQNLKLVSDSSFTGVVNGGGYGYNADSMEIIGVETWDVSELVNFSNMFKGAKITSLDLSNWDVGKANSFKGMFENCTNLQTIIGLENWNTSSVYAIVDMFKNCKVLSDFPNIQNWNLSNCAQFDGLFYGAGCGGTFRPNWNLANIGNGFQYGINGMFRDLKTTKATTIDLSNCTVPKNHLVVNSSGYIFAGSPYITEVKFPKNLKVGSISGWFKNCSRLSSVDMSNVDLSECIDMSIAFMLCTNITSITFSDTVDTSNVNDIHDMFNGCSSLTSLDVSNWNTSNVTNMNNLFNNTSISDIALASIIAAWDFSKVQNMESMLSGCKNITTIDFTGKDLNSVTSITQISDKIPNLETFIFPLDNNNVITTWRAIFSSSLNLKTIKTFNLDRFSLGVDFNRYACAYASLYSQYKYDIDFTFEGTLHKEGARVFFEALTYMGSVRGILNKISAASWERMFRNNLHDYSGTSTSATLQLSDIVLAKLTPTQIAIATNKGWTLQGGAST